MESQRTNNNLKQLQYRLVSEKMRENESNTETLDLSSVQH